MVNACLFREPGTSPGTLSRRDLTYGAALPFRPPPDIANVHGHLLDPSAPGVGSKYMRPMQEHGTFPVGGWRISAEDQTFSPIEDVGFQLDASDFPVLERDSTYSTYRTRRAPVSAGAPSAGKTATKKRQKPTCRVSNVGECGGPRCFWIIKHNIYLTSHKCN